MHAYLSTSSSFYLAYRTVGGLFYSTIFSLFITLNEIFDLRRHKIIISLILFDFAMKNISFIADHRNSFGRVSYHKFISFMYEEDFPEIAEEFNINLDNWRLALERAIAPPLIT